MKSEVELYSIRLGDRLSGIVGDTTVQAMGIIECSAAGEVTLIVYFLADGSPVPAATISSGLPYAEHLVQLFLQKEMMPVWIDLLRHEKPVYVYVNTKRPGSTHISTSAEPIGEEES
jgi:hypothetical protein